jgi:hypothetical protein
MSKHKTIYGEIAINKAVEFHSFKNKRDSTCTKIVQAQNEHQLFNPAAIIEI